MYVYEYLTPLLSQTTLFNALQAANDLIAFVNL